MQIKQKETGKLPTIKEEPIDPPKVKLKSSIKKESDTIRGSVDNVERAKTPQQTIKIKGTDISRN